MELYEVLLAVVEKAREEGIPDLEIQDALSAIHLEITNKIYLQKHYDDEVPSRLSGRKINA